MKPYLELVSRVLRQGTQREDRTGTGTISCFGTQTTFDLREGFPATTSKRLAFKAVVGELLGFIKGADNLNDFDPAGAKIWQANYEAPGWSPRVPGDLGRIYGTRYRKWRKSTFREQPKPTLREGLLATVLGVANGKGTYVKRNDKMYRCWNSMIARCYDPTNKDYARYGKRGVYVVNEWLEFAAFLQDIVSLPGYIEGYDSLQLDKDKRDEASGFCYGPKTCQWLTPKDNAPAFKPTHLYKVEKNGLEYQFTCIKAFAKIHKLHADSLWRLIKQRRGITQTKGFTFVSEQALADDRYIDQLQMLINGLKTDPYSRRHLVTMWNPAEDEETVLPPCHYAFQCYVADRHLDMIVVMRSLDLFLGFAFDIASYAILQTMLAREAGLTPRMLTFQVGDTHIYVNHLNQVHEMLGRTPRKLPKLVMANKSMFDLTVEDITLEGYDPHPTIPAPMAV